MKYDHGLADMWDGFKSSGWLARLVIVGAFVGFWGGIVALEITHSAENLLYVIF